MEFSLVFSVGITVGTHTSGLKGHDILTEFHEEYFRHSGNIKVITITIREVVLLVLLMGRISQVSLRDILRS
jgi:hypothetical protein